MIWISVLLVAATLAVIGVNVSAETPQLGAGLLIGGPVPWALLGALWGGLALGTLSWLRGRSLPKLGVVLLEAGVAAAVTWYVFAGSVLPPHTLAVDPGDPFPAYALVDQEGTPHELAALEAREPALYVFYRGHW